MSKHRTTETLREMLFQAIEDVRAGKLSREDARTIANLADRIIDTAELELKHSETLSRLDKMAQGITPGRLLLTGGDADK